MNLPGASPPGMTAGPPRIPPTQPQPLAPPPASAPPGGAGAPPGGPPQGAPPAPPQSTTPVFNNQLFAMAVQLLRDERQKGFRIDVETDSTVAVDQEGEQKAAMQMIQAVGGFMQSAMPMMQSIPAAIPLFGKLVLFVLRRFPIGVELEGSVEDTIAKLEGMDQGALGSMMQENGPNAGKQKLAEVKQQIAQGQLQANQAKVQAEIQKAQLTAQSDQMAHQADIEGHQMDMQVEAMKAHADAQRAQIDQEGLQHEQLAAQADHQRVMEQTAAKAAADQMKGSPPLAPQRLGFMPTGRDFDR